MCERVKIMSKIALNAWRALKFLEGCATCCVLEDHTHMSCQQVPLGKLGLRCRRQGHEGSARGEPEDRALLRAGRRQGLGRGPKAGGRRARTLGRA